MPSRGVVALAVVCSVIVAIGLGVGLGVGLSNQNKATEPPPSSTTSGQVVTATTVAATTTPVPDGKPWSNYRLPDYIIPSHYRLKLHPNMSTDDYTGTNAMSFNVIKEAEYVLVHADKLLEITKVELHQVTSNGDRTMLEIEEEFRYLPFEYYVVKPKNVLPVLSDGEQYLLTMEFKGSLVGRIVGLYKSVYNTPTGEQAMVGSDMEPTDARKAYPCFDEPALKIRYTTTLVHEAEHVALSNMNVSRGPLPNSDGLMETEFHESVPMSTYLACFCIGDFIFINETSEKNKIPLRVYIPPHQKDSGQAEYALIVMKKIFDYFENLFDMDYSLPKCDMIAIPNFGTGAMENWGLITYRETNLLWDPKQSSTANKQRVAAVVSHELVHQWFGNIVTMKWWDNIWLNEGFASFLEYLGLNVAEPDWDVLNHIVIDDLQPVMRSDAVVSSHPIVVDVKSPSQITSVFDSISYSKGASVLRMMRDILGHDHFIGGINYYLKQHIFGNADEKDLWNDVQEYLNTAGVDINITEVMDPWVRQMGLPVINVTFTYEANQKHFLTDPNADLSTRPASIYGYEWTVDVTHIVSSNTTNIERKWLKIGETTADLGITLNGGEWAKLNPGQTGYYRVNYDLATWQALTEELTTNHSQFSQIDRSNLIDDGFNLAAAEYVTYPVALNLTRYLDKEKSYYAWDSFSSGSSYIRIMLENTAHYQSFKTYYLQKVKPIADELGWNASIGTHVEKLNRNLVLALALRYGDVDAMNNATQEFDEWIKDSTYYLYPDLRQLIYRYGIVGENKVDQWDEMLDRYLKETVATEKTNLLRGLTSTEDVALIGRMLEYSKNESIIKSQDFFTCITYISYTPTGNRMSWAWVQTNWEYMVDRFTLEDRNLGRLVPNIVSDYNTDIQLWEVENFFEKYPEAGAGESGRVTAINEIKTNINWMSKNQIPISQWLEEQLASTSIL